MAENTVLTDLERHSLRIVLLCMAACVAAAVVGSVFEWWLVLAVGMGALGGLIHEIAQSGGKILFFQRHEDGLYLGAVAGIVLGAIAGMLMVRGSLASPAAADAVELTYESLIAGLGLKGVIEAAGGRSPVSSDRQEHDRGGAIGAATRAALLEGLETNLPRTPPAPAPAPTGRPAGS